MVIQLSSGQGPVECELAVAKLFASLSQEFPDIELIATHSGNTKDCYRSLTFITDLDLSFLEGSVKWICNSPFRPHHKRKNWFVDVSVLDNYVPEGTNEQLKLDDKNLTFQTYHCGGHGGQNVNKVSTGVRLTHLPTNLTVTSTAQRSQLQNKQDALRKLNILLQTEFNNQASQSVNAAWLEHNRIVRGEPTRVYEGMDFKMRR